MKGNAIIGQSGGPTVVINQSLVGCIEGLKNTGVGKILGAHHAVSGIIKEDFIDLGDIPQDRLDRIALTPSAAIGSSRDKPDEAYCKRIFTVFEKHDVHYFFYIGGNDSSDTCRIVNEVAKKSGYDLQSFHIPKTIDNDLMENDHTPGYPSAARFVANAFTGDNLDNKSIPGIKINIVMGRHAGFLTAASVMARQKAGDGPHLIYVPERAFDIDKFVGDVDRVYKKEGRCLIAISEGIHDANGTSIAARLAKNVEKDAHGNVQLSGTGALGDFLSAELKDKLGGKLRVRADTFGYLQRCYPGSASPVDQKEAREVGRFAAKRAVDGISEGSIAIKRKRDDPYESEYALIKLTAVAAKTRVLSDDFIGGDNDITDKFRTYLAPLIGELPVVEQF
ncbi:MAG: 6-phosphofructokinase [Deltaproteobacteria bacterium RIFOXYA12_FULL_58_15]|nr:MAG: 6-phosphofructokinase [Deltaproteobacteria bacterium RIFOXYA12_FULL_58_15]OGR09482.1 MAG: 6-phosphofructokinase [Deltaproteobacteria bacterium RIFOXYB12_FULL_58_9]